MNVLSKYKENSETRRIKKKKGARRGEGKAELIQKSRKRSFRVEG